MDLHRNFAYGTVLTAPSPALSGTSLVVNFLQGTAFPTPPFDATVWPASALPVVGNAEIARVLAIVGDTFTIQRAYEYPFVARAIVVGDQIAATITNQVLLNAEAVGLIENEDRFLGVSPDLSGGIVTRRGLYIPGPYEIAAGVAVEIGDGSILEIG